MKIVKRLAYSWFIPIALMALTMCASCSKDDDELSFTNPDVEILDDGTTSNGSIFTPVDDSNFYIDHVKYTVTNEDIAIIDNEVKHIIVDDYLEVSGYDSLSFNGKAVFAKTVSYKGRKYVVKSIGRSAFENCKTLTYVVIPNTVTIIKSIAFARCSNLKHVTIPNSVTDIRDGAFVSCNALKSVVIPNSVIRIGSSAFSCHNLSSIMLPDSVTSIGSWAFAGTPWLKKQPNGVLYINNICYVYNGNMPENTSIKIKDGTKSIAQAAFFTFSNLTAVEIPNTVNFIGDFAFGSTGLKTVTVPSSVQMINHFAFASESLESIHFLGFPPYSYGDVARYGVKLYVPHEFYDDYKAVYPWCNFTIIEE